MPKSKERIEWIDLARAVAILAVVGFHFLYEINSYDQSLRPIGFVGASLFFIISGFMLSRKYANLTKFDIGWFKDKYVKIASLYYPALIVIALLLGDQTYFRGLYDLILHFLFLNFTSHDTAFSIISPAWFIIPLIALYVVFPFINKFMKKYKYFILVASIIAIIARLMEQTYISFSPVFFLGEFCFGIALAQNRKDLPVFAPLLIAVINPIMVLPYLLFYIFTKIESVPFSKVFNILGKNTFEIFLFHESVIMVLLGRWNIFGLERIGSIVILALSFAVVLKLANRIRQKYSN